MNKVYASVVRALVVVALLAATATAMLVTVRTAQAADALAVGSCEAYGSAFDFRNDAQARKSALAKCKESSCLVVATVKRGCAALAVDYANACGGHGWGKSARLGARRERGAARLLSRGCEGMRHPHLLL